MNLVEQWEQAKRDAEAALAERRMDPEAAAKALAHLDYRLARRPRILQRRRDRNAWRKAQTAKLLQDRGGGASESGGQW